MSALATHWDDLVTVALLGTDRRDPPVPPAGVVADLVADVLVGTDPTPAQAMRTQVVAMAVARRAGVQPGAVLVPLAPPQADPRPVTVPELTVLWRRMIVDWPVLDDEVQLAIAASGRRTAPDLLVMALARARTDAARHARAVAAGGALARWLVDLQPQLRPRVAKPPAADVVATLPALSVPTDLMAMAAASPKLFADHLRTQFDAGAYGAPQRALLVNLMARVPASALQPVAQQLGRVSPGRSSIGIAVALADLATVRHHLLAYVHADSNLPSEPSHP
jgi:hypothetical protein